jgi:uncharacterized protein (DUF1015 family)
MASVRPFAALRPQPELAASLCALPYDVMSSEEARAQAAGNPLSFLHVSKPEIDLPVGTDLHDPRVYATGRQNLERLRARGALRLDAHPCFYLYRQVMGSHSQTGLVAVASCEEYLQGIVRKHELTRPDKEEDRLRHIETLESQTGPVFLVHPASATLTPFVQAQTARPPEVDFVAADGVRHTAWTIAHGETIHAVQDIFAEMPRLYIADGHHRCAAAARLCQKREGAGASAWFLAVLFPHDQVQILPYHRVLRDLNGRTAAKMWEELEHVFEIKSSGQSRPASKHEVCAYAAGQWRTLRFRRELVAAPDPAERLDVALLQTHVLGPVFGIENPRTSQRLDFVGGIRGPEELERLVNSGQCACAFSMFPTGIEDLMAIADAGGLMPPKSTWFEPKLRDGMFSHNLDPHPRPHPRAVNEQRF